MFSQRISEVWRRSESVYAGSILARILQEPYTISAPLYIWCCDQYTLTPRYALPEAEPQLVADHHVPCRYKSRSCGTVAVIKRYPTRQALVRQRLICVVFIFLAVGNN